MPSQPRDSVTALFPVALTATTETIRGLLRTRLNVSYTELLILVFPAWVSAVSVVILRRSQARTLPDDPVIQPGSAPIR